MAFYNCDKCGDTHAGLDEGRSQARAPLQQGEYPVWPEPAIFGGVDLSGNPVSHGYSATQVNELLDAARGAAQAAPAPVAEDAEDAARWRLLPLFMQGYDVDWVELLYNLEVTFKRGVRAQAAQPEGGAK